MKILSVLLGIALLAIPAFPQPATSAPAPTQSNPKHLTPQQAAIIAAGQSTNTKLRRMVANAMRAGLKAIVGLGSKQGAKRVGAGNYGGKLGPFHYHLKDLLP